MNVRATADSGSVSALPGPEVRRHARAALREDAGRGDVTTDLLLPAGVRGVAELVTREPGVIAGLALAEAVFRSAEPSLVFERRHSDGERLDAGSVTAVVSGPARGILTGERVALNFVQRLSGIATLTARFVAAVEGTGTRIVDTRKTTPGLRSLEKYAVRCGGGHNHRFDLSDGFMLKDNHRVALAGAGLSLVDAVAEARKRLPHTVKIEIEVDRPDQVEEALAAGADVILFDNMAPAELAEAVALVAGRALTEASGGITLESCRAVAETGVDLISVGALTHSAPSLDVALDFRIEESDGD